MARSARHRTLQSLGGVTTNKAGARIARIEDGEVMSAE
jgi:hypothetical protein